MCYSLYSSFYPLVEEIVFVGRNTTLFWWWRLLMEEVCVRALPTISKRCKVFLVWWHFTLYWHSYSVAPQKRNWGIPDILFLKCTKYVLSDMFEGVGALTMVDHEWFLVAYSTTLKVNCDPFFAILETFHWCGLFISKSSLRHLFPKLDRSHQCWRVMLIRSKVSHLP